MLKSVWRKGKPLASLLGMQLDAVIMENSMDIPLKTRNKTTVPLNKPTTRHILYTLRKP